MLCPQCNSASDEDRGVYTCRSCNNQWVDFAQLSRHDQDSVDVVAVAHANIITLLSIISSMTGIPTGELSPMGPELRMQLLQWKMELERAVELETVETAMAELCSLCKSGLDVTVWLSRVTHRNNQECKASDLRHRFKHMIPLKQVRPRK